MVLKGGTSLRKFRAGNAGRFSTDLDFAAPDADTGEFLLDSLDGAEIHGVRFRVVQRSALRGRLEIDTPLGRPDVPARVEISPRALWLPVELRGPVPLPVHRGYEFPVPEVPVPALSEALAEKLAAWRRRRKMRDLYDLSGSVKAFSTSFSFGGCSYSRSGMTSLSTDSVWDRSIRT